MGGKECVHLNQQNHITLFPKQSLKEGFENWYKEKYPETHNSTDKTSILSKELMWGIWKDCAEWVKKNNY